MINAKFNRLITFGRVREEYGFTARHEATVSDAGNILSLMLNGGSIDFSSSSLDILWLFFRVSLIAQLVKNLLLWMRPQFDSWVWKIRWRRDRLPTPVIVGFPCGSAGKESAWTILLYKYIYEYKIFKSHSLSLAELGLEPKPLTLRTLSRVDFIILLLGWSWIWGEASSAVMAGETDSPLLFPASMDIVNIICLFSPSNISSDIRK